MKKTIYFILFLLLLFTACSKENEENIRPITDLPCGEQGTYFLSATIGDSVLCYASDSASASNNDYFFVGNIKDLSDYYGKDTSLLSIPIVYNYSNDETFFSVQYTTPIYTKYDLKQYRDVFVPVYDRATLEEDLNDRVYRSQNLANPIWGNTPDFHVLIVTNDYNNWKGSYFGFQDSSYIRLFDPIHLFNTEEYNGYKRSAYKVSYEVQSNLYDVSGSYLYPFKSRGTFRFYFFISN
ncbi:hypothetical protein Fleli_1447 [Bernardetia litoralis DSM 6794]|uniref:Lipoprotein n=1 Tax=Bernardetia litoralis (strain ATCC 23117 / DSM 6794 / NBRC 15988 / NCIMB 1366 / Fx l1 / Sio-4) TaxID=880071 RepID=I4AIT8_BERLS|nr:hypothetical protein [Bernardetia litoralis]AFM03873.1 hypothetical protein Fleli_1447 [Bernardetia litoralis DSM 6794]